jgi:hypothetical protein
MGDAEPLYDEALALYRSHEPNLLDLANAIRLLTLSPSPRQTGAKLT